MAVACLGILLAFAGCSQKKATSPTGEGLPTIGPAVGPAAGGAGPLADKAGDPRAAYEAYLNALASGDFGAAYDMLSNASKKDYEKKIKAEAEKASGMPDWARAAVGVAPMELAKLPPREAYVKMASASRKLDRAVASGAAAPKVTGATVDGQTATLTVDRGGAVSTVGMVREGGAWKVVEGSGNAPAGGPGRAP